MSKEKQGFVLVTPRRPLKDNNIQRNAFNRKVAKMNNFEGVTLQ